MGLALILAQVVLVVLQFGASLFAISLWIVFLPAILLVTLFLLANLMKCTLVLDSFTNPLSPQVVKAQPSRLNNRRF